MRNEITDSMIDNFNFIIAPISILRIERSKNDKDIIQIKLTNEKCIDSYIINITNEFERVITSYFSNYNIKIHFNNTRSCFWNSYI